MPPSPARRKKSSVGLALPFFPASMTNAETASNPTPGPTLMRVSTQPGGEPSRQAQRDDRRKHQAMLYDDGKWECWCEWSSKSQGAAEYHVTKWRNLVTGRDDAVG